jgi:hypothetical protein
MRSKLIGIISVAVVAVSFAIACLLVVQHAVGQVEKLSMEAQDLVEQGKTEDAIAKMTQLASEWKRHQQFLELLVSHDEMHTVVERYTEAEVNLKRDHLDDYFKSMALLQEMLDHIRDQERVRWGNVL